MGGGGHSCSRPAHLLLEDPWAVTASQCESMGQAEGDDGPRYDHEKNEAQQTRTSTSACTHYYLRSCTRRCWRCSYFSLARHVSLK
jgi:hypothetical protein